MLFVYRGAPGLPLWPPPPTNCMILSNVLKRAKIKFPNLKTVGRIHLQTRFIRVHSYPRGRHTTQRWVLSLLPGLLPGATCTELEHTTHCCPQALNTGSAHFAERPQQPPVMKSVVGVEERKKYVAPSSWASN